MRSSIIFCLAVGLTPSIAHAKAKPTVVVFPVVPLPGEVDMTSAGAMTKALLDDFQSENGFAATRGQLPAASASSTHPRATGNPADYRDALAALAEGRRQVARLRFPRAIRELRKGIDGVTRNLDALGDYGRLLKAYVLLSEAYFRRGKEASGTKVLEQLVRVRPTYRLDPKKYPPLFLSIFNRTRKKVLARPRGSLEVRSSPPGAQVVLNGKPMGKTPLVIQSIVAGPNHLVVRRGAQAWSDVVNVRAGDTVDEQAPLGGGAAAPSVADSIAANRFDAQVREAARRQARAAGGDYALLLAMGRGEGVFSVGGFLGDVHTRAWTALAPVSPDVDMLSANIEAHNLAREITKQIGKLTAGSATPPGAGPVAFLAGKPIHSAQPERGSDSGGVASTVQFVQSDNLFATTAGSSRQPVGGARGPIVPEAPPAPAPPQPVSDTGSAAAAEPFTSPTEPAETGARGPIVAGGPQAGEPTAAAAGPGPRRAVGESPSGSNGFPALASSRHQSKSHTDDSLALPPLTAPPKPRPAASQASGNDLGIEIVNTPPESTQPKSESVAAVQLPESGSESDAAGGVAGTQATVPKAEGGLVTKWWFWTAIGVGVAAIAGGTYLLVHDQKPSSMVVMAVWK